MPKLKAQRQGWARTAKVGKRKKVTRLPTKRQLAQRKWRFDTGRAHATFQNLRVLAKDYDVAIPVALVDFITDLVITIHLRAQAEGVQLKGEKK